MSDGVPEPDPERRAIRTAMRRLLQGTPLTSDGRLTIVTLANEAGVKRWVLTHKHTDLKDEFYALRAAQGGTTEQVRRLQGTIDALIRVKEAHWQTIQEQQHTIQALAQIANNLAHERLVLEAQRAEAAILPLAQRRRARSGHDHPQPPESDV